MLVLGLNYSIAQSNVRTFLAIQPSLTIEPFYEKGELDVNVLPIVAEWPLNNRMDFRVVPTLNYHFGGSEQGLSDVGSFFVFPVYYKNQKESRFPFGFYTGPVIGLGRNLMNDHYTVTLAVEPGYFFQTNNRFSICMGMQLGGSYFLYESSPNKWLLHWGPKFSFGFWLGNPSE